MGSRCWTFIKNKLCYVSNLICCLALVFIKKTVDWWKIKRVIPFLRHQQVYSERSDLVAVGRMWTCDMSFVMDLSATLQPFWTFIVYHFLSLCSYRYSITIFCKIGQFVCSFDTISCSPFQPLFNFCLATSELNTAMKEILKGR